MKSLALTSETLIKNNQLLSKLYHPKAIKTSKPHLIFQLKPERLKQSVEGTKARMQTLRAVS